MQTSKCFKISKLQLKRMIIQEAVDSLITQNSTRNYVNYVKD